MKHTAESRQQADSGYTAYVTEAYRALTLWCQDQRKIPTGFETFSTGVEAGIAWQRKQTPLQAAALAALVAWRKLEIAYGSLDGDIDSGFHDDWEKARRAFQVADSGLRDIADALIAAEGGTG